MLSILHKVAQKYPGGDIRVPVYGKPYQEFDSVSKEQYYTGDRRSDRPNWFQLWRYPQHFKVNWKSVDFIIKELSDKYFPYILGGIDNLNFRYEPDIGHNSVVIEDDVVSARLENDIDNFVSKILPQDRENKFRDEFSVYIYTKIFERLSILRIEHVKNLVFHVRVYGSSQAYGGPEEGGWWYDDNQVVYEEDVKGLNAAKARCGLLEKEYKEKGKDTFYDDISGLRDVYDEESSKSTGMGDMNYDAQEGMDIPRGWTSSAFEKFFVQIEMSDEPLATTKERPHYE